MKNINPRIFAEGNHKKARFVSSRASRGQKEAQVFLWDVAQPTDDNLARYNQEPIIKIHRWWGGGEKALEYGKVIIPTTNYLMKHLNAALTTGALLIINSKFASIVSPAISAAWLIDNGEEAFVYEDADLESDDPNEWKCLGWAGEITSRVYLLSEEKAELLESRLKTAYNKKEDKVEEEQSEEKPVAYSRKLNWPYSEKSD